MGIVVLATLCSLGCLDQGRAQFEITELTTETACLHDAFPMAPTVMNLAVREDSRGIFMQTQAGSFDRSDLVYLEIYDSARTNVALPTGRDEHNTMAVAAEIEFGESCPTPQSLRLEGTVFFERLDMNDGGRIIGHTQETVLAQFLNGNWIPIGQVDGDWDFEVLHTRTRR
jgi:hypothetical protein